MIGNKGLLLKLGFIIVCFYTLTFVVGSIFHITLSDVKNTVASFGFFGPAVYSIVLLLGLTIPFNPVSDFLVVNVAALLFSPIISILFTFISHSFALTINYHVGKKYAGPFIKRLGRDNKSVEKLLKRLNVTNLFFLRFFLPTSNVVGVEVLSYIAGHDGIPFWKFFAVSIIPWTALNILYFSSTYYFREKAMYFYFLPAILLIALPMLLFLILKKSGRIR